MGFRDFLDFINTYFYDNTSHPAFMRVFFSTITSNDDLSVIESSPFESDAFDEKAKKIRARNQLSKRDAIFVKSHFNENNFFGLIDSKLQDMDDYVRINLENELQKFYPEFTHNSDISPIICQLFLRYIDEMANKKRSPRSDKSGNKKSKSTKTSVIEKNDIEGEISFDDQTMTLARNFCIDHEEEKEIIPLCQIGYYIDPLHKHNREMYTEYNRLNKNVQKAIMFLNEIPVYEFEENWEYKYLELFREDAKKQKLIKEKDLLYDGGKYFHRAKKYSDIILNDANPLIFPAIPNRFIGDRQMDLIYYIDEYLYYRKDKEVKKKLPKEPPFEWMIKNLGLLGCPEDQLTYYMCLYIYSACHLIPREYGRKKLEEISYTAPNLEYSETMEDFYYAALMTLYNIYS